MAEAPSYLIVGRGRWAARMREVLAGEHRRVSEIGETRMASGENDSSYERRLAEAMRGSNAQIAWLCVSPKAPVPGLIAAALDAGLHTIVEKPWYGSPEATESLTSRAKALGRTIAVHFEYGMLEEVERWRREFHPGQGLEFGGQFLLSRPDRQGIPAVDNLGSHLLAIREYAVPESKVREMRCGYEQPDQRSVWVEKKGKRVAQIDLLASKERIIQRFIARMEASLGRGDFPLDLKFALRVAKQVSELR